MSKEAPALERNASTFKIPSPPKKALCRAPSPPPAQTPDSSPPTKKRKSMGVEEQEKDRLKQIKQGTSTAGLVPKKRAKRGGKGF